MDFVRLQSTLLFAAALLTLAGCAQQPATPAVVEAPVVASAAPARPQESEEVRQERLVFFVNDVRHGDCAKIEPALAAGVPIDGYDNLGQTPLLAAVSQTQIACVTQLLDKGADVNLADGAGWSPLIHAAYFGGDTTLLTLLLDRGAKVNAQNNRGLTALYLASAAGHEPTVELLLKHGADPSIATQSGYTPLRVAQMRGLTRIVALLEGAGARPDAPVPPATQSGAVSGSGAARVSSAH